MQRSLRLSKMKKIIHCSLAAILVMQIGVQTVWAAPTPAEREEQNQRARQEAIDKKERQQRSDVFLQPPASGAQDIDLPEESLSFLIHTIELTGEHQADFDWLDKVLAPYQGKNIGIQGINLIVKRATNALIEKGYVTTRIVIPEQDLSSGTLKLVLIPGIIHDIRFQDPKHKGSWETAFPTRPGDILNLRHLEQGLEQLKRVPSQDADMQLVPAETPGQTDIVITIKQTKPWKVVLSADDSGSEATGKLQLSQTFSYDNLFKANDLFNFSVNHDAENDSDQYGTKGNSVYYSRPDGNWTYTFSHSNYDYHQTVLLGVQPITYSGTNSDLRLTVEKLLTRDQTSKTHLEFGLAMRQSKNFIEDTEIEVQRKDTTALTIALAKRQYLGQATVDARLAHKQGVSWFGAQQDFDNGPTTRYHIWTIDLSLNKPIKLGNRSAQYRTSLSGQFTDDQLYTADGFSIGNRYTVRGFDGEQTLAAERGWYLQNEISVPLKQNGPQLYWGLDYGQISGPSAAGLSGKDLAGTVLGLRGLIGKSSQYDVFIGWSLKKPEGFTTANPTYGFQWVYQI